MGIPEPKFLVIIHGILYNNFPLITLLYLREAPFLINFWFNNILVPISYSITLLLIFLNFFLQLFNTSLLKIAESL